MSCCVFVRLRVCERLRAPQARSRRPVLLVIRSRRMSRSLRDSYRLLQLPEDAETSQVQVKEAYRRMAKLYHPDSGLPTADPVVFSQIEEAYRTVLAHLARQQAAWRQTKGEEEEDDEARGQSPQHRQYLSYEGVGSGTPSQRERQYRQFRMDRATEQVMEYRRQELERTAAIDEGAVATREMRSRTRQIKITQAVERLVEDLIQESMARGDFHNLRGSGKPLNKFDHNPYADPMTHNLNRILIDNGYQPQWIVAHKEIRETVDKLRTRLLESRAKLGDPPSLADEAEWEQHCQIFKKELDQLNKKVDTFNLIVPLLSRQMVHFSLQRELERAVTHDREKRFERKRKREMEMEQQKMQRLYSIIRFPRQTQMGAEPSANGSCPAEHCGRAGNGEQRANCHAGQREGCARGAWQMSAHIELFSEVEDTQGCFYEDFSLSPLAVNGVKRRTVQVDLRRRQVSKSVEEVHKIIKDLTSEVSSKDGRFQSISNSGVHSDSVKDQPALITKWAALVRRRGAFHPAIQVLTPTLFLISVPLRGLVGYKERRAQKWRYYTLSGSRLLSPVREPEKLHQWLQLENFLSSSQEWHDSHVTIEGDIVPAKVVSIFKEHLEAAIKDCRMSNKVNILETLGSVVRVAVDTSEGHIEVELVPTVELINSWPRKARWPRLLKRWPPTERARCIKSFGFNLLATSNYHWLLSFSRAEQVLLESIDEDGGCRRKSYRIVRQLKEDSWCPGSKPVITACHLQNLLFWTCEKYPCSKDWKNLRECVLRLTRKLLKCVSQRYLRHYFVHSYNLLKYTNTNELDDLASKISAFLNKPGTFIH
ncbi:protein mab-21-like 3 [Arapaima gigas]